jgi:predicted alpha-1,6-mannanase (GH76 family)
MARSRLRSPLALCAALLALAAEGCATVGIRASAPGSTDRTAPAAAVEEAHRRADLATEVLLQRYWSDSLGSFMESWPSPRGPTGYWTYAQAADAVLDAAERTGGRRYADRIRALFDAQDRRGWRSDFFDDEAWMALFLLRAHAWSGEPVYLDRARSLVEDIALGASDSSCCGAAAGGLWWDRAHTQKATAANGAAALAAARLYRRTGEARWLSFAKVTYAFWLANMVDPGTGRVADHLQANGRQVWWRFTYNEGVMIGAAVELHRATGDEAYLRDARRLAAFMLAGETEPTVVGPVLSDGPGCGGDCDQFKGIAHRYLGELLAEDPGVPGVAALLRSDAAAIWSLDRNRDGIFGTAWTGPPPGSASLAAQSAAATALNLEARRAAPYPPAPLVTSEARR